MRATKTIVMALALGVSAWTLTAQPDGGPRPRHRPPPDQGGQPGGPEGGPGEEGNRPPPPPPPPVIAALDANKDRVISADELGNASAALKKLDKNTDGQLTEEELRPPLRPPGDAPEGPRPPRGERPDGARPPGGNLPEGGKPPVPPLIKALDANGDGTISADEVANAAAALRSLDKNNDGQLTVEEVRPEGGPRPPGPAQGDRPPRHRPPPGE